MKEIVRKTAEVQFNGVTSEINSWKNMVSKLPPFLKDELVGYTLQILTVHFQENKMLGGYICWELHRKFHTRKDIDTFFKLTRAMSFTILEIIEK